MQQIQQSIIFKSKAKFLYYISRESKITLFAESQRAQSVKFFALIVTVLFIKKFFVNFTTLFSAWILNAAQTSPHPSKKALLNAVDRLRMLK